MIIYINVQETRENLSKSSCKWTTEVQMGEQIVNFLYTIFKWLIDKMKALKMRFNPFLNEGFHIMWENISETNYWNIINPFS